MRRNLDWFLKNQIQVTSAMILSAALVHLLSPQSRTYTWKLFALSYPKSTSSGTVYIQGTDDIYFVAAWIVNFTALRAIAIDWTLQPLARFLGVEKKNCLRFAEQGWLMLYYGMSWCLGMHLWYNSVYWLNNAEIWTAWPAKEISGPFKWYYLSQLAFWIQQILVVHIEARRKDHVQMLTHHVITCCLIFVSYVYRYHRAGNVVLCLMDLVDVLLPAAKILRYLHHETACNVAFGAFVVGWFLTRHVMYPKLCWDIYVDVPGPKTMLYGCYDSTTNQKLDMPAQPDYFSHLFWPFQDLDGVICLNTQVKYIFLGYLLLLQTLCIVWFGMILKVIWGLIVGGKAEDIRSDDEEEVEDEEEEAALNKKKDGFRIEDLNVCVGGGNELDTTAATQRVSIDDLNVCVGGGGNDAMNNINTSSSSSSSSTVGTSTLASPRPRPVTVRRRLLDAENRKDLLARIGCEKPI